MTSLQPLPIAKLIPLVTGGGSGIGRAIVDQLIKRGATKVYISGRREVVLQETQASYPPGMIDYKVSDTGNATDRINLFQWIQTNHPDCNALINNAGIQRRVAMVEDMDAKWEDRAMEIEINLHGPIHLCTLFLPHFLQKKNEVTVLSNVSSGLAFIPFVGGPVYSATKAAIHNYTMSLRYSLQDTNVRVIEIVPPAVKSNLGGSHDFGEEMEEYIVATMDRIESGELEVGYNMSETARTADRHTLDNMMNHIATMTHTPKFPAP
jgi:uncharacterized oxidoreductase